MSKITQKKGSRTLSWFLSLVMIVTMVPTAFLMHTSEANAASGNNSQVKASVAKTLKNPRVTSNKTIWDCVYFGHYPQSKKRGGGYNNDPIKWRVLSVKGDEALLLSDKNIDGGIQYNTSFISVTWKNCTMRSWLNGTFINKAFTPSEQSAINKQSIKNHDNPITGAVGGNDTIDKIFLLSLEEVGNTSYGFSPLWFASKTRVAVNTAYTASKGQMLREGNADWWWLRSPGNSAYDAAVVQGGGRVHYNGRDIQNPSLGCRPALHLNLKSDTWSNAGTVDSNGKVDHKKAPKKAQKKVTKHKAKKCCSRWSTKKAVKTK